MTYIVFMDGLSGFKHIPQMTGDNLAEVVESIHEGCCGLRMPSQHWMYYIYKQHESNVPIVGTKFDTYKYVKAVAGSKVENPNTQCRHQYALTHNSSMAWFFTDNMFE